MSTEQTHRPWTFLTNHAQVLLSIAQNGDIRLKDVADRVGITERAAQRIVQDLVGANYLERRRVGRRNQYVINPDIEMRHAAQEGFPVGQLLDLVQPPGSNNSALTG